MNLENPPPPTPDDTQPNEPISGDTEPLQPVRRAAKRPRWLLLLIAATSISLLSTLGLLWTELQKPPPATPMPPIPVVLAVDGAHRQLMTRAQTVGVLLVQEGVTLDPEDAISDVPEALLYPGMVVTVARARDVALIVDGVRRTLRTPLTSPYDILIKAGLNLRSIDRIWLDGTEASETELVIWPVPVVEIEVRRAVEVRITEAGAEDLVLETTALTVGEALFEAGVDLYLSDIVTPEQSSPLNSNTTITITRAQPLIIEVDGMRLETRTQGGTVADALVQNGIALVGLDYVIPGEAEPVEPGMLLRVVRVTEALESVEEVLPYTSTLQPDPELELDQRRVIQAGQTGLRRIDERVRYENGIEIGREPAGSVIVRAPVDEIVAYGTQIVLRTIETPEGPREYWRVLRMYATSYYPAELGGDSRTSIGETLRKGIVASDPRIIRYRTNLFVPGYGLGLMADTGGPRSSPYWIDLGYSDEDYQPWSRYVDVYLLTPLPAQIDYLLPTWTPLRGRPDS